MRLIALFLFLLTITACGDGGDKELLSWKSARVKKSAALTKERDSPTCEVNLSLLICLDRTAGAVINKCMEKKLFDMSGLTMEQAADSFASNYVRLYQDDMKTFWRNDKNVAERKKWYEYRYSLTMREESRKKETVTCTADIEYYEGGLHGIKNRIIVNFNSKTGSILTLDSLLREGYEERLTDMLLERLMKKTGAKTADELRQKGFITATPMLIARNYIITEDGIIFVYNPYEIADYEKGFIELTIKKDELWK